MAVYLVASRLLMQPRICDLQLDNRVTKLEILLYVYCVSDVCE